MSTTIPTRAIYSIDPALLSQFNATFAPRERSRVVERLIQAELDRRKQTVIDAVRKIETDPRCATIADVSADMDALAGETW